MSAASTVFDPFDFGAIIGKVALELLGEPTKRTAHQLTYGKTGKLVVRLKGNFSDFAAGVTGGTLALVEHVIGCTRADALRWLADHHLAPPSYRPDESPGNLHRSVNRSLARPLYVDDDTPARDETAVQRAMHIWAHTTEADADHPYLIAKNIGLDGLPIRDYRGSITVPLYDATGTPGDIIGLQFIFADGKKRVNKGIRQTGAYTVIGTDIGQGRLFCEGLATGATLNAATNKQVIVAMNAGNLPVVVRAMARPGDAVAADNDTGTKPGERWNRPMGSYGTGHKAALACGLPIYLPPIPGADFNDMGISATREVFDRPPISDTPILDVWQLERLDSDESLDKLTAQLSSNTNPTEAAQLASTIARRMARMAPAQLRLIDIRNRIERAAAPGALHPATMDSIMARLEQAADYRRRAALIPTNATPKVRDRHAKEHSKELPMLTLDQLHGVILVRAPMGTGKTQIVGRSAADLASAAGLRFLAITHRRTLVRELAERLALSHYGDLSRSDAEFAQGLATCLPSIAREDHAPLVDNADVVFIDEISQVLRFIESETHCRTKRASNQSVYNRLRQIVANAQCVIGADAQVNNRVIEFLESARPGERFRLIEMDPPRDAGIQASYRYGQDAPAIVIGEVLSELAAGGKVWLAVESRRRAQRLAELFADLDLPFIALHADNTGGTAQKAFLADADAESRKVRLVIASPVIGSGISIEHKQAPESERFTLGAYIGGGHSTTPADAAQQLGRVRYLTRWEIGFTQNNNAGDIDPDAMLAAASAASRMEGTPIDPNDFDRFVAGIRAEDRNARADFAAGLIWQLDAAGWQLELANDAADDDTEKRLAAAADEADAKRRKLIKAAPRMSDDEAAALAAAAFRDELQSAALEAHRIRSGLGLGLMPITDTILDLWSDGAILARLDRFAAFQGLAPEAKESELPLSARRHHRAMVTAYRDLFAGVDILNGYFTPETADLILDRVMQRRDLYAHLGIVAAKFAQCRFDKQGHRLPMARPKVPTREVNSILRRMGLETEHTMIDKPRSVTERALILTETPLKCHTQSTAPKAKKSRDQMRIYRVTADSLRRIQHWSAKRAAVRNLAPMPEPSPIESPSESPPATVADAPQFAGPSEHAAPWVSESRDLASEKPVAHTQLQTGHLTA